MLAIPVFVLEMGGHLADLHMLLGQQFSELAAARLRHAGRSVGWLAVLRSRLAVSRHPQSQHVHADRSRHGRRVDIQRRRDACSGHLSARLPRIGRLGRGLFRGGGGDHRPRAARPGAGTARARADLRRDPGPPRPRAEDRAPDQRRRHGRRSPARHHRPRRPPACAARARRCLSTARSSMAARRSTNRW